MLVDTRTVKAIIDPLAGFCGGVKRAIDLVEKALQKGENLAVKGELIHNRLEVDRLYKLGLLHIDGLDDAGDRSVLIRTHGEEGHFLNEAQARHIELVDATCPKVMRSQNVIKEAHKAGKQIIIVGHLNHPEVIALQGHCDSQAIVVEQESSSEPIDATRPTLLIAQTTVASEIFIGWQKKLKGEIKDLQIFDSRCNFVTRRQREVMDFARQYPAVVFVGGRHSSNSNLLYNRCKDVNINTLFVEDETELDTEWLKTFDEVGVTGSASTPMWLLEKVARAIQTLD
jgi:4-hydroxy-3-methylbut-2-enyl diphosphate reductase